MLIVSAFKDGTFYGQAELRTTLKLGRSADNGLVLDDPQLGVSRNHATLEPAADGTVTLTDLGGPNGTQINGEYISTATLRVGDQFTIGPYQLVIEDQPITVVPLNVAPDADVAPPARPARPSAGPPPVDSSLLGRLLQPKVLVVLAAAALLAGGFAVVSALRSGSAEENPFPPEEEIEAPPESAAPPIDSPAPTIGGTTAPPEPERSAPPVLPPSDPRPQVSPPTPQRSVLVTVPGITPQRGEDQAAYTARVREVEARVGRANGLIRQGHFDEARTVIQALLDAHPGYPDALAALQALNDGRSAAVRDARSDADRARAGSDLAGEAAALTRLNGLDPSPATTARLAELAPQMIAAGEKAFTDGETFETFRRLDQARRAYESAVRLLPPSHHLRAEAEKRLRELGK